MSFSSALKKELCNNINTTEAAKNAECYGLLLFAKSFSVGKIKLSTENVNVANRFVTLISQCTGAIVEKKSTIRVKNSAPSFYTVSVPHTGECKRVFTSFGHSSSELSLRINRANIDDESLISAFLRGVFLCCGTVTDPKSDYHLEFSVPYKNLCGDLCRVISEVAELNFTPKIILRKGNYIAYIKGSERVTDFITYIGAPASSMQIIEAKILKEIRNDLNRKINSEVANMERVATAAAKQIKAINKIKSSNMLESLPEELRELCILRLESPELSLNELGQAFNKPVSRSGVNHRMNRLLEIADGINKD